MKPKPAKAKRPTVHLIGNAHLDPVWLWRWQEGFAEAKATFRSALDRMTETPGYVFTCAAAAIYEWVEQNDPAMFREIRLRVRQGRWAIAGGWWIQSDANIPCGESLIRQALHGQRYFREKFGVTCTCGYCVDTFGHPATLPKILAGCGMRGYMFMRPDERENPDIPKPAFRWIGDDGTAITALHIPGGYTTRGPDMLEKKIADNLELVAGTALEDEVYAMYGVGNHGGGPTKRTLEAITKWRKDPDMPRLIYSWPERFMEIAESRKLPVWRGELQHHAPGCYAAESMIKAQNRRAEQALLAAEMWGAVAHATIGREPAPPGLDRAWKHLLFTQFHDILAGTSIPEAYRDSRDQLGAAVHDATFALNGAQQAVSWRIDTRGDRAPLVVFNNQPFDFEGVMETEDVGFGAVDPRKGSATLTDNDGKPVPSQAIEPHSVTGRRRFAVRVSVGALGYTLLRDGVAATDAARRLLGKQAVRAKDLTVHNDRLRISLDRRGYLVLYDKLRRRQVFDAASGVPIVIEDTSDTWSHGIARFRKVKGRFRRVGAELIEAGPVRGGISVRYKWGDSLLTLDYLLGAGEGFVTVRGRVDWREQWKLLKLAFPVPFRSDTWTAEAPYGTVRRATNGDEDPVGQWLDLSGVKCGLAVANDCKYSASVEPGEVRVTILRSPAYAFHDPHRTDKLSQHEFIDQGPQTFRLALIPHAGDWREARVIETARFLNRGPNTLAETYHPGPLGATMRSVTCRGKGVYIGAIKQREDGGGLIVRAAEWFGRKRTARFEIPALGRRWTATFHRGEIKTFLVPDNKRAKVREVNMLEE